jgi:hypothetical protein
MESSRAEVTCSSSTSSNLGILLQQQCGLVVHSRRVMSSSQRYPVQILSPAKIVKILVKFSSGEASLKQGIFDSQLSRRAQLTIRRAYHQAHLTESRSVASERYLLTLESMPSLNGPETFGCSYHQAWLIENHNSPVRQVQNMPIDALSMSTYESE